MPSGTPAECRIRLGLDPERPTLLVTGGSQGARSINRMLARVTTDSPKAFEGWQILHQCGSGDSAEQQALYQAAGVEAVCHDYLDDMASAWGAADLAVARCGAGTDLVDPEQNAAHAGKTLIELLGDAPARQRMHSAFASLGPTDGARTVAERLIPLLRA